jgi:bifunctional UDP-N-acetylglucosamine pyrophosphorylase/glucosamine-1-phosphate N-acetyltransferase
MKAIILAAGQGKRMMSPTPKVMHKIMGRPMLEYAIHAAGEAGATGVCVVISPEMANVRDSFAGMAVEFATQSEPLGTGHAVMAAEGAYSDDEEVLILYGDMPLVTGEALQGFVDFFRQKNCDACVATVFKQDIGDFGRVYDTDGVFGAIVEARDVKEGDPPTNRANTGICMFRGAALRQGLAKITRENSQNEYYLTDVPKILSQDNKKVLVYHCTQDESTFTGINTQLQLSEATWHMQCRINLFHMGAGVRIPSPDTTFIDATVHIDPGAALLPGTILEGATCIRSGATIGPNSHLVDTTVESGAVVRHSVCEGATVGAGTGVGPFAYLRPGAVIGAECRIGNFVEIKNANLARGVKMAHLSYIGDADVGENVNYSCGAITANYDGKNKHRTTIGNNAFIGSNANLVAPLTIGDNAFVAAGSTITDDLPPAALGVARGRQYTKENWKK